MECWISLYFRSSSSSDKSVVWEYGGRAAVIRAWAGLRAKNNVAKAPEIFFADLGNLKKPCFSSGRKQSAWSPADSDSHFSSLVNEGASLATLTKCLFLAYPVLGIGGSE